LNQRSPKTSTIQLSPELASISALSYLTAGYYLATKESKLKLKTFYTELAKARGKYSHQWPLPGSTCITFNLVALFTNVEEFVDFQQQFL